MKALKWIGIILLVIIVVGVIAMLALPTNIKADQSVVIDASPETVWPMVSSLRAANEWSPWMETDTGISVEFSGEPGTVGEKQMWTGGETGTGEMEIIAIEHMQKVETDLRFKEPREGNADAWIAIEPEGEGTKVTWGFETEAPMPGNLLMALMGMKGMVEEDYKKGLEKLKEMAEAKAAMPEPETGDYTIETGQREAQTYLAIRKTISWDEIGDFFGTNMPALGAELGNRQLQPVGPPSGIYWSWDEENQITDMAVAMPVSGDVQGDDKFSVINLPASNVLMADYFGAYEEMEPVHMALDQYVKENNLEHGEVVLEEYITDPGMEPDTAKWHTRVIYYLK